MGEHRRALPANAFKAEWSECPSLVEIDLLILIGTDFNN